MNRINQDVIRKHARVPRSYREATGKYLCMRNDDHEPAWIPIVGGAVFGIVFAVLFFLGC